MNDTQQSGSSGREPQENINGSDAPGQPALTRFVDALISFAFDPSQWDKLLQEVEANKDAHGQWDPGEFLATLSRAESLSWKLKHQNDYLSGPRFAYILVDDKDRVTAHSGNLGSLGDYVKLKGKRQRLEFLDPASQASYEAARRKVARGSGHVLVELAHTSKGRQRFGYLVGREDFPVTLADVGGSAVRALLIAHDQPNDKLARVIQGSFGLTDAETAITLHLASGLTLKETAAKLEVSVNTARNHLQAVFDKSGIKRQPDLLLMVTQLSVLMGALSDADQASRLSATGGAAQPQHYLVLTSGRRLAYRTYGDPRGSPVLYFHETIGSSLLPAETDRLARDRCLYLIAAERPGFGYSDPEPNYCFDTISDANRQLLDHLRVDRVALVGYLTGAGHALEAAGRLGREVSALMLLAGRPPLPLKGTFDFLMTMSTKMVRQPWLLNTFFNILRNRTTPATSRVLIERIYGAVPADLQLLESQPEILEYMVRASLESMTLTASGIVDELKCFADATPSDVSLIDAPILVWHGAEDRLASPGDLEAFLGDRITERRIFEGEGSLAMQRHWPEVLDRLADAVSR